MSKRRAARGGMSVFSLEDAYPEVALIRTGPEDLAKMLRARGLAGDVELAEYFEDMHAILPVQLARMRAATKAMEGRLF